MTRTITFLGTSVGLVVGLALWPTPGDARKCVGPSFRCDAPEGCELANQMMLKWAYRAVFADPDLAAMAIKAGEVAVRKENISGLSADDIKSRSEWRAGAILEEAAVQGARSLKLPKCENSTVKDPPGMTTNVKTCEVTAQVGTEEFPIDKIPASKISGACDEIVEASRRHEAQHVKKCTRFTPGLKETQELEQEAYTIEIHYLRDQMAAVGQWCTPSAATQADFSKQAKDATRVLLQSQIPPVKAPGKGKK